MWGLSLIQIAMLIMTRLRNSTLEVRRHGPSCLGLYRPYHWHIVAGRRGSYVNETPRTSLQNDIIN